MRTIPSNLFFVNKGKLQKGKNKTHFKHFFKKQNAKHFKFILIRLMQKNSC